MPDELSEECKQKLREMDRELAEVRERLLVLREASDWTASDRIGLANHATEVDAMIASAQLSDEPCQQVLRGLDHSATFLARQLSTVSPGGSFEDQVAAQDLLMRIEDLQFAIQSALFEAL